MQLARIVRMSGLHFLLGLAGLIMGCGSDAPQGSTEKASGKVIAEDRKESQQQRKKANSPGKASLKKSPEAEKSTEPAGPG